MLVCFEYKISMWTNIAKGNAIILTNTDWTKYYFVVENWISINFLMALRTRFWMKENEMGKKQSTI